jgi:hypothetical protein
VLVDLAVVFATEVVVSCWSVGAFVVDAVWLAAAVSSWRFTADGKIAFAISWRPLRIDVTMLGVLVRRRRPQNICREELVCSGSPIDGIVLGGVAKRWFRNRRQARFHSQEGRVSFRQIRDEVRSSAV